MDLGSYLFCAVFCFVIVHSTDMYVVIMQQYKIHIKFILSLHKGTLNWKHCVVV